ncbi:MAG: GNAT family N-acetyltransferase [Lachnospiraceae bacterium]|nr:GNAT family N-acetyltransferase [Lachnospiraceae bacterium]
MRIISVEDAGQRKKYLRFRKNLYHSMGRYVDNNYFMLLEIFGGKLHFVKDCLVLPVYVEAGTSDIGRKEGEILCEGVFFRTAALPEYLQLCFFEALPKQEAAVRLLMEKAEALVKEHASEGCRRLVIGLNGHVNYGLGLQASHHNEKNSFSSPGNPSYYNKYFRGLACEEVYLDSYYTHAIEGRLDRFAAIINKLNNKYTFRAFRRKQFAEDARIYTDLNNACFTEHKYYYARDVIDDMEMLRELFLFMKEDSIIYAFDGEKPVGFIMWYPDFNELAERGTAFGAKHYFRNLLQGKKIRTAKVMEYGVLKEYRGSGLPMALMAQAMERIKKYGCDRVETSWILRDNVDSNSFCKAVCDSLYKEYVVFEKTL